MPYVGSDGNVLQKRPFGIALIMDYVWGFVGFVNVFFRSMFHMDDPGTVRGQYGSGRRGPNTPGGMRRMGGVAPPPCVGGG